MTVANVPPTFVTSLGNVTLNEGQTLSLPTVQFTDPTFANPAQPYSPSFNYTINWGDGSAASTGAATVTQSATSPSQGQFTGSHLYSVPGTYTATVTVVDNEGGTTSETFQVVVVNVPPTIGPITAQNTSEGSTFSLAGAMFNDPGTQETYTATINWGDGLSSTGTVNDTVMPSGASGTVSATHVFATTGVYTATLTVNDSDGGSSSETFQITVANVPPTFVASLGNVTLNEGQTLSLPTVQFTDPTFANPAQPYSPSFNYTINWGDGSAASTGAATVTQSATSPSQGQFTGSHLYSVPGTYTATVTVVNNEGGTTSETFQVVVVNVPPTIAPIATQNGTEAATLSLAGVTFTDPGTQETYTATIDWGDGNPTTSATLNYSVTAAGAAGTIAGSHIYADAGTYSGTITIVDSLGGTSVRAFTVVVADVAPSIAPPATSVNEGSTYTVGFTDPGFNNPLFPGGPITQTFTYNVNWGDGTVLSGVPVSNVTPGGPGTPTQGSLAHVYGESGTYTVTVTVFDRHGASGTLTYTLTVLDVPPAVAPYTPCAG